ncbi:MAG TPA: alpha/beta hydrolase [Longimicrobium sp.]|nr:alpha/beta hydrolase [Longimicrobium sp.]
MMTHTQIARAFPTLVAATLSLASPAAAQSTKNPENLVVSTPTASGFAPVNGLQFYYEVHGTGKPLVLLHGGVSATEAFGGNLAELARGRQVIAVHLQGHGRTRDIDRPLRYETMADDVAALIAHLGLEKADVMGYSLGGGVALQAAIRHPASVDRLVVVSGPPLTREGWYPEVRAAFEQMPANAPHIAANVRQSPLAQLHPEVDWESLFRKIGEQNSRDDDWSAEVAALRVPAMFVYADADAVRPEHVVEIYRALGGGERDAGLDGAGQPVARLAIIPGATHYDILSTTLVAQLAAQFLDAPLPQASAR